MSKWMKYLCVASVAVFGFGVACVVKVLRIPKPIRKAIQKGSTIIGIKWS